MIFTAVQFGWNEPNNKLEIEKTVYTFCVPYHDIILVLKMHEIFATGH